MKANTMMRFGLVTLSVAGLVGASACTREAGDGSGGEPVEVTSSSIQIDMDTNVRASLGGIARAMRFVNDSRFIELMPTISGSSDCYIDEFGDEFCDEGGEEPVEIDFEEGVDELAEWLQENLFTEANVEESTATSVTYLIPPSLVCDAMGGDVSEPGRPVPIPGDGEPAPIPEDDIIPDDSDSECVRVLTEEPLRIQVTSPREGDLDLAILIGQQRANPLKIKVYHNEISATVDLGAAKTAAEVLAEAAGEEAELPEVLRGSIRFGVYARGNDTFEAAVSVVSPIEIISMSLDHPLAIRLGASDPTLSVKVDGAGREITAEADVSAVDLMADMGMLFGVEVSCSGDANGEIVCDDAGPNPYEGRELAAHLGGASARLVYTGDDDRIVLENLGLGNDSTTLKVDGQQIVGVDVNANNGRRFSLTAQATEQGVQIDVSPAFEVNVALDMRHMPDAEEYPAWTLDENLNVSLSGASAPSVLLDDESGALRVLAGRFKLSSDALGRTVTAETNQCLWFEGDEDGIEESEAPHPFEAAQAGVCQ